MNVTIEEIRKRLNSPLPGEMSHFPLYPTDREVSSDALRKTLNHKESAVALIVYKHLEELKIILMQRPIYEGFHSGQVCFPGGKKELDDSQLIYTAIRESQEEIGLQPDKFELLGKLTPVYIPVSNFRIQPFVFYYKEFPIFNPSEREVAEVFSFPVQLLFQEDIVKNTQLQIGENTFLPKVPYFDINQKVVWGATAFILNEFRTILQE